MDEKMRRDIILDNYQNPANRGLPDDESYTRVNSKNDSCVDNIDVAAKIVASRCGQINYGKDANKYYKI